ncbi:hypothetical protein BGX26_010860 [Mortierella sp. AD094]|nr:hypothetical protein BGX26_010860 [Mortierella sp. AD094]
MAKAFEDTKTKNSVYLTMKRRRCCNTPPLYHARISIGSTTSNAFSLFAPTPAQLYGYLQLDTYSTKKTRAAEEASEKATGDSVMETDEKDKEYSTLVRLTHGTQTKLSTLYTNIIKINMDALKKKERKKVVKAKKVTA